MPMFLGNPGVTFTIKGRAKSVKNNWIGWSNGSLLLLRLLVEGTKRGAKSLQNVGAWPLGGFDIRHGIS